MEEQQKSIVLHPELSYKITGILFDVFNTLGSGHKEKIYQQSVAAALTEANIKFAEQVYVPIQYKGRKVGTYYLDFLIEDKIILELKQGKFLPKSVYRQVIGYLQVLNLELAIIGCFAFDCVVPRRIINIKNTP